MRGAFGKFWKGGFGVKLIKRGLGGRSLNRYLTSRNCITRGETGGHKDDDIRTTWVGKKKEWEKREEYYLTYLREKGKRETMRVLSKTDNTRGFRRGGVIMLQSK